MGPVFGSSVWYINDVIACGYEGPPKSAKGSTLNHTITFRCKAFLESQLITLGFTTQLNLRTHHDCR